MKIPVSQPFINNDERKLVNEAINKKEISGFCGKFINEFEKGFAEYSDCRYGVSTTSGTTALHLALAVLKIGPGDEVLTSTFTNMATFFAVLYTGAKPVPVDIEPDTWNLNPLLLEKKITRKTKAILVAHIYGHPVDMDPVLAVAKKYNLFVVEDCAEAHGSEYKGKKVGSLGDIGCFSFYANKIITTGEGGMITTNNKQYADRARMLKSLAFGNKNKFMHQDIGFNFRMTNLQAALGCAQLKKIEFVIKKKRDIAAFYIKHFKNIKDLQLPVEKPYAKNVYWMFHIVLRGVLKNKRHILMSALERKGIETREAFVPYNSQEIFIKRKLTKKSDCPIANIIGKNGFYLPSGPILSAKELLYVVDNVKSIIKNNSK